MSTETRMKQIDLGGGVVASSPNDLATVILAASDKQVTEKSIEDAEGRADFLISTNALNYWRITWRCSAEWGMRGLDEALAAEIRSAVCR